MNKGWFRVRRKETGVLYFAKVSGTRWYSDDAYSKWEQPAEYTVVAATPLGLTLVPDEDAVGVTYGPGDMWNRYERVKGE